MSSIPWNVIPAAFRDQFGVHRGPRRAAAALAQGVATGFRRVSAALRRRVTLEQGVWLVMALLLLAFLLVLFLGTEGHGGYGRF